MPDADLRLNFVFDKKPIRGELVRLEKSFQTIVSQHSYDNKTTEMLGGALASIALLNGISKHEGRIILQFQGAGKLSLLSVHCSQDDQLRALIQVNPEKPDSDNPFQSGQLVLFYEPSGKGQRYQSIIEVVSDNIAKNMEHYFAQSEQIQTQLWLSITEKNVSAMMLQLLPDTSDQKGIDWEHVTTLAQTITDEELSSLPFEEILHRLFHEEDLRVFDKQVMRFGCPCSKQKMEQAILNAGKTEIDKILLENDTVEINCEYCGNNYAFDSVDVECLFGGNCSNDSNQVH